jgi:hypothetical protein
VDDLGAQYREAKAAVVEHVRAWGTAELALVAWLKAKRGVPAHLLYDAKTGGALDPELATLERAVRKAEADVAWCRALVIACGEAYKGCAFEDVPNGPPPVVGGLDGLRRA